MKTVAMVNNHNGCPRDTLFKLSKLLKEKERREGGREGENFIQFSWAGDVGIRSGK